MILTICFEQDLISQRLLELRYLPCLCRVSETFKIEFFDPLPVVSGTVTEWDRTALEQRVIPGTGGEYSHYALSEISLASLEGDRYLIVDLKMFHRYFGWCEVLKDGAYVTPGNFWDEE
ncbi:hypothetical protein [Pseudomonas sp. BJa3]|uniref:hypothetical protein n=1 Tax=Pseudomonas sp. BJa3 TaxID=2986525 RepID=UPI002265F7BD|nr:hypothetical protein [Pseudomonas sp. BJa3]MCX5510491.1 hypothetical protein [Pseudomonas sp. BJa3]